MCVAKTKQPEPLQKAGEFISESRFGKTLAADPLAKSWKSQWNNATVPQTAKATAAGEVGGPQNDNHRGAVKGAKAQDVAPAAAPPPPPSKPPVSASLSTPSAAPKRKAIRGGKDRTSSAAFGRSGLNIPQ